jgi:hypothetical protein
MISMPQFDFYSFYEQVLVLLLVLYTLHLVFLKFYFVDFLKDTKVSKKLTLTFGHRLNIVNLFLKNL